ncbi:MAG TPA: type II secretion system protein F, partial [Acidimicrobiia bacterium]|nr:type II secretion system protein F [Acidimicrobiia bacterium]
MSVVVVLVFGAGVFVVYDALTSPPPPPRAHASRVRERACALLARAGLPDVRPSQLVGACAGAGLLASLLTAVVVGSLTIALLALCAGAYVPVATLRARARSRRRAL